MKIKKMAYMLEGEVDGKRHLYDIIRWTKKDIQELMVARPDGKERVVKVEIREISKSQMEKGELVKMTEENIREKIITVLKQTPRLGKALQDEEKANAILSLIKSILPEAIAGEKYEAGEDNYKCGIGQGWNSYRQELIDRLGGEK